MMMSILEQTSIDVLLELTNFTLPERLQNRHHQAGMKMVDRGWSAWRLNEIDSNPTDLVKYWNTLSTQDITKLVAHTIVKLPYRQIHTVLHQNMLKKKFLLVYMVRKKMY
jgi:hypothetical protein